jgi:hypothetical protein
LGSEPPALVAATITFGAGVSAAFVGEGDAAPFFMTIGAVADLSAVSGLDEAKELETFDGLFVTGSSSFAEGSLLSATVVATAGFTAFSCKAVCGLREDIVVDAGAVADDAAARGLLAGAAASETGVVDFESLEAAVARPLNCVQPAYRPTATTTAAAIPIKTFLLPPLDGSEASAP